MKQDIGRSGLGCLELRIAQRVDFGMYAIFELALCLSEPYTESVAD